MTSMREIVRQNKLYGYHFFDSDTVKYWGSINRGRVQNGKGGVYFVTEETKVAPEFRFKVRRFYPNSGRVETAATGTTLEWATTEAQRRAEGA